MAWAGLAASRSWRRLRGVLFKALAALAVMALVSASVISRQEYGTDLQSLRAVCPATKNWPGAKGLKYAFTFGDSYTATGFDTTSTQPSPSNPLGNPPYPGWTSANGPNWVDFLTVKYNASLLQNYNLAYGGATVDASLVTPYTPTVLSLSDQVRNLFLPKYAPAKSPQWKSANTLFPIFIGINDIGNSYYLGVDATTALNKKIFAVYASLVESLYAAGARNFVFINVPPVDRSPLTMSYGASAAALEKADIAAFNAGVASLAKSLKASHVDTNVFAVDSNAIFTNVLNNPKKYPQTSGLRNTTGYCLAYQNGTPAQDTLDPSCGVPVNQYFWLNSLHPTYPVHDVLAQEVSKVLAAGPNVC